jgi:hypothetical protein
MSLKVRYGMTLPVLIGLVIAIQAVQFITSRNVSLRPLYVIIILLGVALIVGMQLRPYFLVESNMLTLYGVGGLFNRKFYYESLAGLRVAGSSLEYLQDGHWRPIRVSKSFCNSQDWTAVTELLAQNSKS